MMAIMAALMGAFIYWLGRVSVIADRSQYSEISEELLRCERGLVELGDKHWELTEDLLEISEKIEALTKKGTKE